MVFQSPACQRIDMFCISSRIHTFDRGPTLSPESKALASSRPVSTICTGATVGATVGTGVPIGSPLSSKKVSVEHSSKPFSIANASSSAETTRNSAVECGQAQESVSGGIPLGSTNAYALGRERRNTDQNLFELTLLID